MRCQAPIPRVPPPSPTLSTVSAWPRRRRSRASRSFPPTRRAGRISRPSSARAAIRRDASASVTRCSPGESWASVGAEELAFRLRTQTDCGHPRSSTTSGLVAYLDGEPVGWCAVEPRTAYPRLLLKTRVPWAGRAEDKNDDSVWAVTCFVTRVGFRRRGISRALARAAVDFARERGARALEGYPMITHPGQEVTLGELHVGQSQHLCRRGLRRNQSTDRSGASSCASTSSPSVDSRVSR